MRRTDNTDQSSEGSIISDPHSTSKRRKKAMTIWSVLALVSIVVGGAATLGLHELWLHAWAATGDRYPVGQSEKITLPKGETFVYYESNRAVPTAPQIAFLMRDADGGFVRLDKFDDSPSFKLRFSSLQILAAGKLDIPADGEYTFECNNAGIQHDDMIDPDDRVVFNKEPHTLEAAQQISKTMLVVTGSTTLFLVVFFYILHGVTLHRRNVADAVASKTV